jgi:predicted DNA-binding transcriptional regulator YafY
MMHKAKRIMELMMAVNRKKKFTIKELAEEFQVSSRTISRDLLELSELGVPLYSEVGPHGGYRILKERVLPPIAFTEKEAVAIFFATHALRHFSSLPFETEFSSALNKFYFYMPEDVRDRIEQMKNRVDIVVPNRKAESPYLSTLLDGSIHQKVLLIDYESRGTESSREIQPIGIYAKDGFWFCPAYCFLRSDFRVFRCDRIHSVVPSTSTTQPIDLQNIHLANRVMRSKNKQKMTRLHVELSREGAQRCETELWLTSRLHFRKDGTAWLDGNLPESDIPFIAEYLISLGKEATVQDPPELVDCMKRKLSEILAKYA